jgi:hypothetical protein
MARFIPIIVSCLIVIATMVINDFLDYDFKWEIQIRFLLDLYLVEVIVL